MSKRLIFDFGCENGHIFEALVAPGTEKLPCRECNNPASRRLSMPTIGLEGWSLSFPTAADKWTRNHIEAAKIARKRNDES